MNGAEIQRMAHNLGLVHHTEQVKWLVKQILRKHKPLTKTEKIYLAHLTQPIRSLSYQNTSAAPL